MNVPANYYDEAERLLTHPYILPRVKVEPTLLDNDKSILLKSQIKQKRESVSFAKYVFFEKRFTTKDIRSTKRSLSQRVHNLTSTPLKHCSSALEYYDY